jgi:hypothetical protein
MNCVWRERGCAGNLHNSHEPRLAAKKQLTTRSELSFRPFPTSRLPQKDVDCVLVDQVFLRKDACYVNLSIGDNGFRRTFGESSRSEFSARGLTALPSEEASQPVSRATLPVRIRSGPKFSLSNLGEVQAFTSSTFTMLGPWLSRHPEISPTRLSRYGGVRIEL